MEDNNFIIKTENSGEYTTVSIKGTRSEVLNSCNGIFHALFERYKQEKDKAALKDFQISLFNTFINANLDANPDAILIVYDQFINGILEQLLTSKNGTGESKIKFLNVMMKITTDAFNKFKKDCENNDKNIDNN